MDKFRVTTPLLSLQAGSKACLFCDLIIKKAESTNNVSSNAIGNLKNIAKRWSEIKPLSSYAKNFELVWDKVKHLDTEKVDDGTKWPAHASCRRNFLSD